MFMGYSPDIFPVLNHNQGTRGAGLLLIIPNSSNCSTLSRSVFINLPRSWNEIYRVAANSRNISQFKRRIKIDLFTQQMT